MSKSCVNCLHGSTHPFGITFIDQLCSGCYTHNEKYDIDWQLRHEKLLEIVSKSTSYRSMRTIYDCIIPISGVAEDYFVVQQVLGLGLNPLLVAVNDYFINDIGWYNLHNLITVFDLDSQIYSPNLKDYKELVSTSFRKHLHILYPSLSLNSSYPVHVAIERNIPLIIWGQSQPIEQVGKYSHLDSVEMTKWSQVEHDRIGLDVSRIIGNGAQLNPERLTYYDYPIEAIRLGCRAPIGIYLNNFMKWDPLIQNYSILKYGFKPQYESATFDPYDRAGSSVYYSVHDLSRLIRHGYRKVRDHLNREIRHGRIDRKTSLSIYKYYSDQKINMTPFFDWLDITESGRQWILQHLLADYNDLLTNEEFISPLPSDLPLTIKDLIDRSYNPDESFIAFGKGI
tara:strand:+ start:701 stop:1891 length:1191 start_codon:yes stop_codon:yes gene_type:complete